MKQETPIKFSSSPYQHDSSPIYYDNAPYLSRMYPKKPLVHKLKEEDATKYMKLEINQNSNRGDFLENDPGNLNFPSENPYYDYPLDLNKGNNMINYSPAYETLNLDDGLNYLNNSKFYKYNSELQTINRPNMINNIISPPMINEDNDLSYLKPTSIENDLYNFMQENSKKQGQLKNYGVYRIYDLTKSPSKYRSPKKNDESDKKQKKEEITKSEAFLGEFFEGQIELCEILQENKIKFLKRNANINLLNIFNEIDTNILGKISQIELKVFLQKSYIDADDSDLNLLFKRYGNNGFITYVDFKKMTKPWEMENKDQFISYVNVFGISELFKTLLNFEVSLESLRKKYFNLINYKREFERLSDYKGELIFSDLQTFCKKIGISKDDYLFHLYEFDCKDKVSFEEFLKENRP